MATPGIAAPRLPIELNGTLARQILAVILPLAFVIERPRGRTLFAGGNANPLVRLFLVSNVGIAETGTQGARNRR